MFEEEKNCEQCKCYTPISELKVFNYDGVERLLCEECYEDYINNPC